MAEVYICQQLALSPSFEFALALIKVLLIIKELIIFVLGIAVLNIYERCEVNDSYLFITKNA